MRRQAAILSAARELALRDGVRKVSLADIAARVGVHKSALLRYFETREQIFLELTAEAWRDWAGAIHAGGHCRRGLRWAGRRRHRTHFSGPSAAV